MGWLVELGEMALNVTRILAIGVAKKVKKKGYYIKLANNKKELEEALVYYIEDPNLNEKLAFAKSENYYAFFNDFYVRKIEEFLDAENLDFPSVRFYLYDNDAPLIAITVAGDRHGKKLAIALAPIVKMDNEKSPILKICEKGAKSLGGD